MEAKCYKILQQKIINILIIPKVQLICDLFDNLTVSSTFTFFEHNDILYSIVKDIKFEPNYKGRVIDIDNDEHHNFLTHSGLVMNGGGKRNGSFAIYLEFKVIQIFSSF